MRTKKGTVKSAKGEKTVVVEVHTYKQHPKYKKKYRSSKKFYAHDPENKYQEGDSITIYETTPISKTKRWTVIPPKQDSK